MANLTRRDWLRSLIRPKPSAPAAPALDQTPRNPNPSATPSSSSNPDAVGDRTTVAIIAGRFCLAYQGNFCTTCSDNCPEPGAILIEQGLPRIIAEACTGCRKCHEVCPAPEENAIRLLPRK